MPENRPEHREITGFLARAMNYDSLSDQEQAIVCKEWANRVRGLRDGLDYEVSFTAAGESYSELDKDDNVVVRQPHAAQVTESAGKSIEDEFDLLTSAQVAQLLGPNSNNSAVNSLADDMRGRGDLLHFRRLNKYVYPGFQFDRGIRQVKPFAKTLLQLASINGWDPEDVVLWLVLADCLFRGRLAAGGRPRR